MTTENAPQTPDLAADRPDHPAHEHTDLWWHLLEDHEVSIRATQGDPVLLHTRLHAQDTAHDHQHHPATPEGTPR